MSSRNTSYFVPSACALAFFVSNILPSAAQDTAKVEKTTKPKSLSTAAEALTALKSDEGVWEAAVTLWLRPGSAPIKSKASVNAKMEVGGTYLEQRFDGKFGPEMGNRDWTSLSYTNFDTSTSQFEAIRMASSGTPMVVVRGKAAYDEKGYASMVLKGEYTLMGKKATERDVISHDGPDKCVIESWMSFDGSEEFKGAEMVLTRVKRTETSEADPSAQERKLRLGNFSVSLTVKDLSVSLAFYKKLGFSAIGGDGKNFLILQNDSSTIGLFQGILEKNVLTFNPGWDRDTKILPDFDDVRNIQKKLKADEITLTTEADTSTTGPASLTLVDPDGNQILIDQHIPRPKK